MVNRTNGVVGSILVVSLGVLYVAWEQALQVPTLLLVAVHCLYVCHVFALSHSSPTPLYRKLTICLLHTFADSIFTALMLNSPLPQLFAYRFPVFFLIFALLHLAHPCGKFIELRHPAVRSGLYLADGFFMGLGVAQGLTQALEKEAVLLAGAIVVGKQALPAAIYLLDEVCFREKPLNLSNLRFNTFAGFAIFTFLLYIHYQLPFPSPFSLLTFSSASIYLLWAAWDAVSDQSLFTSIGK